MYIVYTNIYNKHFGHVSHVNITASRSSIKEGLIQHISCMYLKWHIYHKKILFNAARRQCKILQFKKMFIKLMFYVKYEFRYNYKLQYINMKMDMKKKA